jgi:flavin-dependent dehydrogenase
MEPKRIAIIGGSVAGLAASLALSRDGHRVLILEKDATPLPESPLEAFEKWRRPGAPQTRHSHAFLARLRNSIRDDTPELMRSLLEHGVDELRFEEAVRRDFPNPELEEGDADLSLLACRRITFEWVLRKHVLATGLVEFRDGVKVTGFVAEPDSAAGLPRVTGVKVQNAAGESEQISADLVIDASGRNTKLDQWLVAVGGAQPKLEAEACGIFYSSRFYRLREGAERPGGVQGGDLGYLKLGVFPGDAGIFSITLCASPHDEGLGAILHEEGFEAAARALPSTTNWVDPAISEPISGVHGMGKLENSRRSLIHDGEPIVLGLLAIGDALIHTNPLNGRGCTLAWLGGQLVATSLAEHPDDLRAVALALEAGVEREIVPSYTATLAQDRDAISIGESQRRGEDPFDPQKEDGSVDPRAYMRALLREGLVPGLREDLTLLRAFMRAFNLLEAPDELMKRPELLQRVMASFARRDEREEVVRGPSRDEMVRILEAAEADSAARQAS